MIKKPSDVVSVKGKEPVRLKTEGRISPALVLFILSPVIGELLSGSSPPAEFFNPLTFAILAALYGSGAVIARELTHRWGKGLPSLLILGAAYGVIEEGLMVKSFFDPGWVDIGLLGSYGRWAGINWVWSLQLTIYHSVFSITIPVMLVTLLFPMQRSRSLVSRRKFNVLCLLLAGVVIFGFFFLTPYRPPLIQYLLAGAAVVILATIARWLPNPLFTRGTRTMHLVRPRWFGVIGFLGTFALFFISWLSPESALHPLVAILLMAGLAVLVASAVWTLSGGGVAWSGMHKLALASGGLSFFIMFAPLLELDKTRPDNMTGMTLVGLAMAMFLMWIAWRIRCRKRGGKGG